MEIVLNNLISICSILSKKIEKCSFHVNQIEDQIFFTKLSIANNYYWTLLIIFIFILVSLILYLNKKISFKKEVFFIFLNFFLIIFTTLFFKNNIPFTDTWYELDFLINTSQKNYLFTKFDNFLFGFRPFHLLIINNFNLNYNIVIYLNIFVFFLSLISLILIINRNESAKFIFLFLLIFFSGKWFNIFYEPVNIVWTINFLLSLLFCYLISLRKNLKINLSIICILFFSIINFKASFITIIFSIFYGLIIEKKIRDKLVLILSPIFLLMITNYFVETNSTKTFGNSSFNPMNYIFSADIFLILKNFISMQSIIYFPNVKYSLNFSFIFSIFQNLIILFYLFRNQNFIISFKSFLKNNPVMIMGLLGCLTTSLVKGDVMQIRYFSYSLLYQVGYLLFIIKNFTFIYDLKKFFLIKNFLLVMFIINLFFFNQGVHFALSKFTVYAKSLDCLKKNQNTKNCEDYIYKKTFYDDESFDKEKFRNIISFLKRNKLTIFNNL